MGKKNFFAIIVEDDEGIRTALGELLKGEDFEVVVFSDGKEAKEYLDSLPGYVPIPDVVLTDMEMPVMDGEELLIFLKEKYGSKKKTPLLVAMSGNGSKYDAAISAGADIFLKKPFFSVAEKIKKILEMENP